MNKEYDFLDIITIISFIVGLEAFNLAQKNLTENRQQTDDTQKILNDRDYQLKKQDEILKNQNKILYKLNGGKEW